MHPTQQAANLATDLADVVVGVCARAARRASRHLVFVLDRDDPTALELLNEYAPAQVRLAQDGRDDVEVVAVTLADGLNLLRTPKHAPSILQVMADQIEHDTSGAIAGVCFTAGAFRRFAVSRRTELN